VIEDDSQAVEHDGFVVVLDVLGMRGVWSTENPREIVRRWTALYEMVANTSPTDELYEKILPQATGRSAPGLRTRYLSFADSFAILLDTRGHTLENFLRLSNDLAKIFMTAIDGGFLFRGAVAAGKFYSLEDFDFYIGPAADDAAHWYDKANWAGIILTPSTGEMLDAALTVDAMQGANFRRWRVPLKCPGPDTMWAIDWPRDDKRRESILARFNRNENDLRVRTKRDATLAFYDTAVEEIREKFRQAARKYEAEHPGRRAYEGSTYRPWETRPP
jgi:hypothetical protein